MIVLKVYTTNNINGNAIPLSLEDDKCYCDHNLNGIDELTFELQRSDPNHSYILEEVKVKAFGNIFVIKKIDEHSDFSTIKCEIDLDDWKAKINKDFRTVNSVISEVLSLIVPSGWNIVYGTGVDLTKRTTVEKQEGVPFIAVTSYDLLDYISKAYSVVFNFNTISKTINVVNIKSYTSSGEFFIQDLNMTELGYNGDSSNFVTRVYAYGKDGLTFADINDGKEYVENLTYSNKVVSYVITDERYTVKENLLAYANEVLAEKCFPVKSYTCKIQNLNADIWLYKVVTIVDKDRQLKVEHQCVKYREYNDHSLDSITLSTQAPAIESIIKNNNSAITESIGRQYATIIDVLNDSVKQATDMITGTDGGHFRWILDNDGKLQELVNLADSEDINTAQKVWRWNAGGLGHSNNGYAGPYDLALTADGKINASMIDTGVLLAALIIANTLTIGGQSNGDGSITIKNASGNIIIELNKNGFTLKNTSGNVIFKMDTSGLDYFDNYGNQIMDLSTSGMEILSGIIKGSIFEVKGDGKIRLYDSANREIGYIDSGGLKSKAITQTWADMYYDIGLLYGKGLDIGPSRRIFLAPNPSASGAQAKRAIQIDRGAVRFYATDTWGVEDGLLEVGGLFYQTLEEEDIATAFDPTIPYASTVKLYGDHLRLQARDLKVVAPTYDLMGHGTWHTYTAQTEDVTVDGKTLKFVNGILIGVS